MDIVDSGRESDDQAIVNGNGDMMAMVLEKFPG